MSYMDHWWAMHEMTWYSGFWCPLLMFALVGLYYHLTHKES